MTARRRPLLAGLLLGLLACAALILETSRAAFNDQTASTGNAVTSGRVDITNERAGKQLFPATTLRPGQTVTSCVTVTYRGTVAADVRLFASAYTDHGLAKFLTVTADEGRSGGYGDCASFVASRRIVNAEKLTEFATRTDFAGGAGAWAPSSMSAVTYRIRVTFPTGPQDNEAQNAKVDLAFGWAAESS